MVHFAGSNHYEELSHDFRWEVPARFNIAKVCSLRWASEPYRIALLTEDALGNNAQYSFTDLQKTADQLSHALRDAGIMQGDRVAILLPQRFETAVAHMAVFQLGAISMPLSLLFGPEALQFRLSDSGAKIVITDETGLTNLLSIRDKCPALEKVIGINTLQAYGVTPWDTFLTTETRSFALTDTWANDPAILIYTSGTTGPPKGALLPHRALIGNLPGFVASQNWFPQEHDVFWSPADWAWTGGLMDALLPSLYFGMPIVGYSGRFSADVAFKLMQRYGVTNTFLFPTALKIMMKAWPMPRDHFDLKLRAIMSAGEAVGKTLYEWCEQALGIRVNEMFGQTEINYIVGNSDRWPAKPGSMGRPYPGHQVALLSEDGSLCPPEQIGELAIHRTDAHGHPDPVFFLGYWNNEPTTLAKFSGDWCRTGDLARMDADGYLWYQGRSDDMFKSAGYRIGPDEIENCLLHHPAVVQVAVVPKPDEERGNIIKAFVVLSPGSQPSAELAYELQKYVRNKLAPYEYPKEIEFISELPMTNTGKIQRRALRELEIERARKEAQQHTQWLAKRSPDTK